MARIQGVVVKVYPPGGHAVVEVNYLDGVKRYRLGFDQLGKVTRLRKGDVIEFSLPDEGIDVVEPAWTTNIHFEELKNATADQTFEGVVYKTARGGLMVSYKGYPCFLSFRQTPLDKAPLEKRDETENQLLGADITFTVKQVNDQAVIITLREVHGQRAAVEVGTLKPGFSFTGMVFRNSGWGLYVRYKYSEGSLHAADIFATHSYGDMPPHLKKRMRQFMRTVFPKRSRLRVTVSRITDAERYALSINMKHPTNAPFRKKILEQLGLEQFRVLAKFLVKK